MFEVLKSFWESNNDKPEMEEWPAGSAIVNNWESPTYMTILAESLSEDLVQTQIYDKSREILEAWTGQELREVSLYGVRVYVNGAVLSPHVDDFPRIASAIINVAQDVDEPWPLEVYGRDGMAVNVTMEPGDMVSCRSNKIASGIPCPFQNRCLPSFGPLILSAWISSFKK